MTPRFSTSLLRAQSDPRLLELVQAGHEAAFEAIVERYHSQLIRYARRVLPEGRCEDAVQQGFMQAWRALQDGKEVRQLRPWLYAIVHNAAVNQLRQGVFDYRELLDTVEGHDDPSADVEMRAVMRQTLSAVAALPERQRDALLKVIVEGRSQQQVAIEMGLTENGLRQLLFRARTTLRSAATAVTPLPVLVWAARGQSSGVSARIGEAAAGAGAVAGGAHVLQTGTALIVAGTLAVGGATALETPRTARAIQKPHVAAVKADPAAAPVSLGAHSIRATRKTSVDARGSRTERRASRLTPAHLVLAGRRGFRVAPAAATESAPPVAVPVSDTQAPSAGTPAQQPSQLAPTAAETMPVTPTAAPTPTRQHGGHHDAPAANDGSGSQSTPGGSGSGDSYPQPQSSSGSGSSGGSGDSGSKTSGSNSGSSGSSGSNSGSSGSSGSTSGSSGSSGSTSGSSGSSGSTSGTSG